MSKKGFILLYLLSLAFYVGISVIQDTPGYMDAQYYYAGALQLVGGKGWTEPYIWNFMNVNGQLPIPAFLYWMPLPSMLAALGMILCGSTSYFAARLPFLLIAGTIPVLTAYWTGKFTNQKKCLWLSGFIALLGGYYLPFITHTDTFVPYFVLGALFFVIVEKMWIKVPHKAANLLWPLLLGIIAGCMHLTRADGILWLAAAFLVVFIKIKIAKQANKVEPYTAIQILSDMVLTLLGYLLIMVCWYGRNVTLFGGIFPPDNARNLWLTQYNDLFSYPTSEISLHRWLQSGWTIIITERLKAAGMNLENLAAVVGGLILLPFMILGIIKHRSNPILRFGLFLLGLEYLMMSIIFPYAGGRGGFFHSGSAFQILLWSLVPTGFAEFIRWGIHKRGWGKERAWKMYGSALIIGFAVLSGILFLQKINGNGTTSQTWITQEERYHRMAAEMEELKGGESAPVMVGNPPGYYLASQNSAVVIPNGGVNVVLQAADRFGVEYLIVDEDHPEPLNDLYALRIQESRLELVESFVDFKIFKVVQ